MLNFPKWEANPKTELPLFQRRSTIFSKTSLEFRQGILIPVYKVGFFLKNETRLHVIMQENERNRCRSSPEGPFGQGSARLYPTALPAPGARGRCSPAALRVPPRNVLGEVQVRYMAVVKSGLHLLPGRHILHKSNLGKWATKSVSVRLITFPHTQSFLTFNLKMH